MAQHNLRESWCKDDLAIPTDVGALEKVIFEAWHTVHNVSPLFQCGHQPLATKLCFCPTVSSLLFQDDHHEEYPKLSPDLHLG